MCAHLLLLLHECTRPLDVRFPLLCVVIDQLSHLLFQVRDLLSQALDRRGQPPLVLRGQLVVLVRQALRGLVCPWN